MYLEKPGYVMAYLYGILFVFGMFYFNFYWMVAMNVFDFTLLIGVMAIIMTYFSIRYAVLETPCKRIAHLYLVVAGMMAIEIFISLVFNYVITPYPRWAVGLLIIYLTLVTVRDIKQGKVVLR